MGLNKQSGNMYPWVTHTWNVVKGKCPHDCPYCYMKRFPLNEVRLDEQELKTDLGMGNVIFVGSSCDMWAEAIPSSWIEKVTNHVKKYILNDYVFQSKNPERFNIYAGFPSNTMWGTTIETNRDNGLTNVPSVFERRDWLSIIDGMKFVSIEPIMDFDLLELVSMIRCIKPMFVSIGADSQGHNLPEPSSIKINDLIKALKQFTEVKIKDNLKRIIN